MPQCLTCGANVPVLEGICNDCGMELQPVAATGAATVSPLPPTQLASAPPPPAITPPSPAVTPTPAVAATAPAGAATVATVPPPAATPPASFTSASTATLIIKRGGIITSDIFTIGGRAVIGRFDPDSGPVDVDLGPLPEAAYVSRFHAEMWHEADGQWYIKDLGSTNGVFVKRREDPRFDRASERQPVGDGDEIALGNARFEFHA